MTSMCEERGLGKRCGCPKQFWPQCKHPWWGWYTRQIPLDVVRRAVAAQMMVDEFGAVVRIDPAQPKGQRLAQVLQRVLHVVLTLAHHGARFHPRRVDVGHIERMQEVAIGAIPGVGHQVNLGEAGDLDVPAVGLERNLMLEQRPRFRAPTTTGP